MRRSWLVAPMASLAVLAGCSSGGGTTTSPASAGAAAATTTAAAPSRLTKAEFTSDLKAAGWPVGADAYTTAVQMCATKTADADIRHLGELADPNASDAKLAAYVDAVHKSC